MVLQSGADPDEASGAEGRRWTTHTGDTDKYYIYIVKGMKVGSVKMYTGRVPEMQQGGAK